MAEIRVEVMTERYQIMVGEGYPAATIYFQRDPIALVGINGCQVDDVIQVAIDRLTELQTRNNGAWACDENFHSIEHLREALRGQQERTRRRLAAGTEGTHEGH